VTAKAAMRAGADYLVHSVTDELVDDEFLALARKANASLLARRSFVFSSYQLALVEPVARDRSRAPPRGSASSSPPWATSSAFRRTRWFRFACRAFSRKAGPR
jgi:hypothetical protein